MKFNIINIVLISLVTFCDVMIIKGQEIPSAPTIIPPGPEGQNFQKYIDVPVSLYTGIPDITIPLYEIKYNDVYIPISLSYHAGGITVSQEASFVGLGWSLQAGGQVNRSVRGRDDFDAVYFSSENPYTINHQETGNIFSNGYYSINQPYPGFTSFDMLNYYHSELQNSNSFVDFQPDIFTGSFIGNSVKFLLRQEDATALFFGNINQVYKFNFIDLNNMEEGFFITDPFGVNYRFIKTGQSFYNTQSPITTWGLSRILYPSGDSVIFEYNNLLESINISSSRHVRKFSGDNLMSVFNSVYEFDVTNDDQILTQEHTVSKILFSAGKVDFHSSNRLDNQGKKLDSIIVTNQANDKIKRIIMFYSYFDSHEAGTNYLRKRLKLDSVKIDNDNSYVLKYNNQSLPLKNSKSVDHWGYYNGANNTTLIPPTPTGGDGTVGNANRNPNFLYASASILNEIKYPTGGSSNFQYELNSYSQDIPVQQPFNVHLSYNQDTIIQIVPNSKKRIELAIDLSKNGEYFGDTQESAILFAAHECIIDNTQECLEWANEVIANTSLNYSYLVEMLATISYKPNSSNMETISLLSPGNYSIVINATEPGTIHIKSTNITNVSVQNILETSNIVNASGLRVSRVQILDPITNKYLSKKYNYNSIDENNVLRSNGVLMSNPKYSFTRKRYTKAKVNIVTKCLQFFGNINLTDVYSQSYLPLSMAASGSYVGYSKVTVLNEGYQDLGFEEYYYNNIPSIEFDEGISIPSYEFAENGTLRLKKVFNSEGGLLSEEENFYNKIGFQQYNGFLTESFYPYIIDPLCPTFNDLGIPDDFIQFFLYPQINERTWVRLDSSVSKQYYNGIALVNKTTYLYDDINRQVSKLSQITSEGTEFVTNYYYPHNFNSLSNLSLLINKNMYNKIIKSTGILNGVQVEGNVVYYNDNGQVLKVYNRLQTGTTDSHVKSTYLPNNYLLNYELNYNNRNLVNGIYGKYGINELFIWGYNHTLPVAKIQTTLNASLLPNLSLQSGLSSEQMNNLKLIFPDAAISVYDYNPGYGLKSVSDNNDFLTTYDYYQFGRLKLIKDNLGNIIKKYDYNFIK